MTKFFKNSKKPYFGAMWPFWPKFGQKGIFLEKRLCQFLNIPSIYHHAKNQKKLICLPKKNAELTDGWKDIKRRTSVRPSVSLSIHSSVHPSISLTMIILQDPLQDVGQIIPFTLSFPQFISKHQKPVYSINSFVTYSQTATATVPLRSKLLQV